jgi:hypothetical protein
MACLPRQTRHATTYHEFNEIFFCDVSARRHDEAIKPFHEIAALRLPTAGRLAMTKHYARNDRTRHLQSQNPEAGIGLPIQFVVMACLPRHQLLNYLIPPMKHAQIKPKLNAHKTHIFVGFVCV